MDIAIIKYNAGNIYSVAFALKRLGINPVITADNELIQKADKVIFPGVGEAYTTMEYLKEHKMTELETTGFGCLFGYAVDVPPFRRGQCRLLGHF